MLTKSNREPTNTIFSIVKFILFFSYFNLRKVTFSARFSCQIVLLIICLVEPKTVRLHDVVSGSVSIAANVIGVSEGSIFEYVRAAFAYTVLCADFFQSAESILRKKNRSKPTRKTN